ncbi:hypothetical protein DQ04_04221000 [Trypanosoma grayi]|uniref:hypothetical protein n=1 Tax=Trypanosoma grayi TaxID=71804 RepID=UPI0004F44DDA|nr:hypothetical protein DQ04_04221000 [Trypanosoma grayi]KEG10068.1 hypothetical protein DQ04_04221000 [Trypanosoma grayi]
MHRGLRCFFLFCIASAFFDCSINARGNPCVFAASQLIHPLLFPLRFDVGIDGLKDAVGEEPEAVHLVVPHLVEIHEGAVTWQRAQRLAFVEHCEAAAQQREESLRRHYLGARKRRQYAHEVVGIFVVVNVVHEKDAKCLEELQVALAPAGAHAHNDDAAQHAVRVHFVTRLQ